MHTFNRGRRAPLGLALRRRATAFITAGALLIVASSLAAAQEILPFSEVKPGMTGVGRTVFSGTRVEEFQVEVVGKLENVAPQRNLILVRLSGGPLASTGVMSGMSGSPVYVGSRLVGAIAYTWNFAKEPLAGVTPIQEMLAIETKEIPREGLRSRSAAPTGSAPTAIAMLSDPHRLSAHFASYLEKVLPRAAVTSPMAPIGTPLLFAGFPQRTVEDFAGGLARAGFIAVQGGASGRSGDSSPSGIVPGAGVGIGLVRGDVEIAAICTITYREEDRVLACGHPLLNLGPTELSMTTTSVEGLFPSLNASFKFVTAGEQVGVFRQDRATGVFGYLGKKPSMIPVRVEMRPEKGRTKRYAFDIVEDPFLAPFLLYAALNGVLSSEERDYGEVTLSYEEGSTIRVAGEDDVSLRNLFSGELARAYASGTVAYITQLLLNSEYRTVHIEGINLILGYRDERRTARLDRAWVDKSRARAGDTLSVSVNLKPYRGPEVTRQIEIEIPSEVPPGRLLLQVGDGVALARTEEEQDADEFVPRDLKQLIWLINHLRRSDKVYAVLTRGDNGILYQGERLPNLPPSIAQVMVRPDSRGNYRRLLFRGVAEEALQTDYALEGYKLLSVEVEE